MCWSSGSERLQAVGVAQCHTQALGLYLDVEFLESYPWRSFQAAFLPVRDAAQAVFLHLFCAQLDLKKAFDKAKHPAISDALLAKGMPVHHVAILNYLWSQSPMLFKLSHVRAARDVKTDCIYHVRG